MNLQIHMDISDFNRKLSIYIADARALEKTDRKRANAMWLKICEFAIEYSKQRNVDRTLRLKIWRQVEVILQKVKGEETPSSIPSHTAESKSIPFEVDFGFDFPSVPEDEPSDTSQDKSDVPFQAPPPPENIDTALSTPNIDEDKLLFQDAVLSPSKETPPEPVTNFIERIKKMEEELRSMPDIFKEIRPPDYTPDKSIIPSSTPPPQMSPEHPTEPLMQIGKNSLPIEPVEKPDTIDPYKGTKETIEIKDPFGPDAQPAQDEETLKVTEKRSKESDIFCYACGAPIREKDITCSKCGAEL